MLRAATLELFEQDVGDAARERRAGAVEWLVDEIEQQPAFNPEAPARRDSLRRERRRRVERPRGRRLPVDDERFVTLVEPVLLVVMGIVIAGLLLALYMPLFQLSSVLGQ